MKKGCMKLSPLYVYFTNPSRAGIDDFVRKDDNTLVIYIILFMVVVV